MIPSKYQLDFWDAVEHEKHNVLLKAVPGSGKTFSLVEALKRIPKYKKTIFLAFSKAIQLELQSRVPDHVDCMTLHSLGYKAISAHFKTRLKLDSYKSFKFSDGLVKELKNKDGDQLSKKDQLIYKFTVSDLIDMARINMNTSLEGFKYVEKNYDILCKNGEVENAIKVFDDLQKYNKRRNRNMSIDYVDMLHIPVSLNLDMPKYDYVAIDEVQDMSDIQMELISKILKPNGRIIAVGDPLQSIFGFAGAAANSMDILQDKFNMKELPLSITYRVPRVGVENLKTINPNIEHSDNAIEGKITHGSLDSVELGDLVICRNTKPLIVAYFQLLAQEKKATIIGKEMENGLDRLASKFEGMTCKEAEYAMQQEKDYLEDQLREQGVSEPTKHYKYASLEEKIDIFKIFLERYGSVSDARRKIHEIFDEKKEGIKLMTCHRSKGLESDRVFFITHFENNKLIPSKYAKTKKQLQQERNLFYVAESRFKKEMIYVKL